MNENSIIFDFTEEWIKSDGRVTCEFSTTPDKLPQIFRDMWAVKDRLKKHHGYWNAQVCETCHGHHGEECYIHVEIRDSRFD